MQTQVGIAALHNTWWRHSSLARSIVCVRALSHTLFSVILFATSRIGRVSLLHVTVKRNHLIYLLTAAVPVTVQLLGWEKCNRSSKAVQYHTEVRVEALRGSGLGASSAIELLRMG